jgi:hypothetical protein
LGYPRGQWRGSGGVDLRKKVASKDVDIDIVIERRNNISAVFGISHTWLATYPMIRHESEYL